MARGFAGLKKKCEKIPRNWPLICKPAPTETQTQTFLSMRIAEA